MSMNVIDADTVCHLVFFFSSRRRHTRCSRDWSSDVCSSDLDVSSIATIPSSVSVPFRDTLFSTRLDWTQCSHSQWFARGSLDRKSTRLNSSHGYISYAVFCLKKKTYFSILSQ